MTPAPIALVAPWYGADVQGGAENVCRNLAEHLLQAGYPVEVLTTCVARFQSDWGKNHHRPGLTKVNGVPVRRFAVSPRNASLFHQVNLRFTRGAATSADDEAVFLRHMVNSDELYAHIAARSAERRFVFIPYLYGTSYWGARAAGANAYMIPCLHDEPYAHMRAYRDLMPSVRGFLLLSRPERDLMRALYAVPPERLHLTGAGVDTRRVANPARFRRAHDVGAPFLLYVGRRDETKNTPLLLEYFRRMKMDHGGSLKLVLVGTGDLPHAALAHPDIVDLGIVDEQTKCDALGAALCLVNPSLNESFSLILMESWVAGRPVLVHAKCAVTVNNCRSAQGGLYFDSYAEFVAAVQWLEAHPEAAETLGRQGRQYVMANFGWDTVIARVARVLYGEAAR